MRCHARDTLVPLRVAYTAVTALVEGTTDAIESVSFGVDRWDEAHVRVPGLYIGVVTGGCWAGGRTAVADRDQSGRHRGWGGFVETARTGDCSGDGQVIISPAGTVQAEMVHSKRPRDGDAARSDTTVEYADWMGTEHPSAIAVSVRGVVAAIPPGEENGPMTIVADVEFDE